MLICYIRACVKGTLHPPGPSRSWSHRSVHRHFWQEYLSEFGWQSNHSDGANAITDYGRTQHTNFCIDFSLLPSGCSHKMVNSCSQYCFLFLLASQMQNQILKQTNKQGFVLFLPLAGPKFPKGSFSLKNTATSQEQAWDFWILRALTEASGKGEKAGSFALDSALPHCARTGNWPA